MRRLGRTAGAISESRVCREPVARRARRCWVAVHRLARALCSSIAVPVLAVFLLWRRLHGILPGLAAGVVRQARCPRVLLVGHTSLDLAKMLCMCVMCCQIQ
jgi:hypothetical protein